MSSPPRSLKSRALQLLAQRDQSRVELRRKLMVHALNADADERADASGPAQPGSVEPGAVEPGPFGTGQFGRDDSDPGGAAARVDAVLAWLEVNRLLCDERFAESRAHARASRFGNLRIRQELKQHGVTLSDDTAQALRDTEHARALAVWERRFGQASQTAAESAKQARFLTARGFSSDTVRRILRMQDAGNGAYDG